MPSSWKVGLQAAVVEQRDLHRVVGRQRLGQQLARRAWSIVSRSASVRAQLQVLAEALLGGLLDRREAAVGAEGGAAAEDGGAVSRASTRRVRGRREGSVILVRSWRASWGFVAAVAGRHGHRLGVVPLPAPPGLGAVGASMPKASPRAAAPRGRRPASRRCVRPRRWPRARPRACRRPGRGSARTTSRSVSAGTLAFGSSGIGPGGAGRRRSGSGALRLRGEGGGAKRGPHEPAQKSFGHGVLA